jgi:hypothetical protein
MTDSEKIFEKLGRMEGILSNIDNNAAVLQVRLDNIIVSHQKEVSELRSDIKANAKETSALAIRQQGIGQWVKILSMSFLALVITLIKKAFW